MLQYSSLNDAFPNCKKKKKETSNDKPADVKEKFLTDYTGKDDCFYSNYNINLDSCPSNNIYECFDNNNTKKIPCEPLQPPIYKIPVDDKTQKSFNSTYNAYIDTQNTQIKDYTDDSSEIKPYYSDDLDMYLNYNEDPKSTIPSPTIFQPHVETKPQNNNELCEKLKSYQRLFDFIAPPQQVLPPQQPSIKKQNDYTLLINIALFIFIGIVIILLCDQITNLAINIGIKRALDKMNINE